MKSARIYRTIFISALGCLLTFTRPALGQCPTMCGDANGSSTLTSGDWQAMMNWIYHSIPAPGALDCAESDGYENITLSDPIYFMHCVFVCDPPTFNCDSPLAPRVPVPTDSARVYYSNIFPAGDSSVTIELGSLWKHYALGLTLPVLFTVDGQPASVEVLETGPDSIWFFSTSNTAVPGAPAGHCLLGYESLWDPFTRDHKIARIRLSLPPADSDRTILMAPTGLAPHNIPAAVHDWPWDFPVWEPQIFPCLVTLTGDVDESSAITSADVIYLINFIFKSGLDPVPCEATADANCDGQVTTADTIELINFVFKGGDPPCNACAAVGDGVWACP